MKLSVVLITHNEAERLAATLEAVAFADEIIVVDSGSTDGTLEIAREFTEKVLVTEDWPGFAVLTTDPNGLLERLAPVAMPMILHAEDHERWLTADWRDAVHLVTPFPSHLMAVEDTYPYP